MSQIHSVVGDDVAHYTCYRTRQPITIDGQLQERAWQIAPKSPRFVDMLDIHFSSKDVEEL